MNSPGQIAFQALRQAHWLPAESANVVAADFANMTSGDNLLPAIARAWQTVVSGSERRRGRRLQSWLQQHIAVGSCLSVGDEPPSADGLERWVGPRLIWWPRGIPTGQRVGLLSSHLGSKLNQSTDWFRVLRAACAKVDRRSEVMVTAATTTTDTFARRAAGLFNLRLLLLVPPGPHVDRGRWLDKLICQTWPTSGCYEAHYEAHVSPRLEVTDPRAAPEPTDAPLADRLVITMSDRLLVFHVRRRGRLLPLIRRRLADSAWQPHSVYVTLGPELVPRTIADELLAAGAVGWVVLSSSQESDSAHDFCMASESARPEKLAAPTAKSPPIIFELPWAAESYLTHCTRAARGAWPDQDQDAFLDDLIFSSAAADHSALAALRRILMQQQLLATSTAIRGGAEMVSFTAVPLFEVPRLRTFRPHRGRWDFEPYGICIRRDVLKQVGARPVHYGDETDWNGLSAAERPFFQRRYSNNVRSGATIDWSLEREWRVPGHLDLSRVDEESAFIFVPSLEDARCLLAASRWPIVVVPSHLTGQPQ